ncbi:DUF2971 domain-containing protein [Cryobacterium soli]|uniref:DUF2971 domain-containing protein n=1 Tax=Cryobacterium soli TaxID=2220095 RepID=UPI000E74789B|nr:DUF2971 domain-containing protein [Cryobacterium soli]
MGNPSAPISPSPSSGRRRKIGRGTRAKLVYHYTDAAGLLGILDSGTLRASSFHSLNDSSEIAYGVGVIREVFSTAALEGDPAAIALLNNFIENIDDHLLERDYFIVCASRDRDSLNQWRNYANGNGYAIGLDIGVYAQVIDPRHHFPQAAKRDPQSVPIWVDVIYGRDEQQAAVLRVLQDLVGDAGSLLGSAATNGEDPTDSLLMQVGNLAATLKHPAFAVEEEVRLLMDRVRFARPEFHAGRAGIAPYIEVGRPRATPGTGGRGFAMACERSGLEQLPIRELICGPGEESGRKRRERVARALLHRHRFEIEVAVSMIPLIA